MISKFQNGKYHFFFYAGKVGPSEPPLALHRVFHENFYEVFSATRSRSSGQRARTTIKVLAKCTECGKFLTSENPSNFVAHLKVKLSSWQKIRQKHYVTTCFSLLDASSA